MPVQNAHAAGIVVNSDTEPTGLLSVVPDGKCTLREAIANANSDSQNTGADCAAGSGTDTITFAGNYTITLDLTPGQLLITSAITITGNGAANTILQAHASPNTATWRVLEVSPGGNLTLNDLTVRHGRCVGQCPTHTSRGGGIYSAGTLVVSNILFNGNEANVGGGVYIAGGSVTVDDSTFTSNTGNGGGLDNDSGGTATVNRSTFHGNTGGNGAGINNTGTMSITSSTFTQNQTPTYGGGIFNAGSLQLVSTTLSDNSATWGGGGIYGVLGTPLPDVGNTIVANSASGGNCLNVSAPNGYNLSSDGTCGFGAGRINVAIVLGTLTNNGGPTQTMALPSGSPAIDAGTNTGCPGTDQRGVARPQGTTCDVGAYEAEYHSISGNAGAAGAGLSYTHNGPKSAAADGSGNYTFAVLEHWSGTVTPGEDGCTFTPTDRTYNDVTADLNDQDYTAVCASADRAPADFDGNGTSDLSVYRPSTGIWYVKNQFNSAWGNAVGDVPMPRDYDGDGPMDLAIYRPSTNIFHVKNQYNSAWGSAGDVPVPGDYDGDGDADVAVWRPSDGKWYVKNQSTTIWGSNGDIPVQADYDGDGDTDLAVFRPSTGVWYIKGLVNTTWGSSTDIPVPGDYNADGAADVAIFRPSTGIWYIKGLFNSSWGNSTDIPVPGDYDGDGDIDVAVWRPANGTWYVKGQFATAWGSNGDFPLVAPDTNGDGDPYQ